MTNPGLLDFFTLEAGEYIEQMDGLLASAGDQPPEPDGLIRQARALRGASTMARLPVFAELAGSVERVGRALREGLIMWEPGLRGVVISAIDDLKILLRAVRTWGTSEDQRAQARIVELSRWAPGGARIASAAPASVGGHSFFADGAAAIAKAIDAFLARGDRGALADLLRHARELRGVAAIRDLPPLAEIIEGVEHAAKPLELSASPANAAQTSVLASASTILRDAAQFLAVGQLPRVDPESLRRFTASAASLAEASTADVIVPIASLFHADAGPHVVSAAPNPPTTPAQRFRLEVVSQAEHLRGLIAEARRPADATARERVVRELRGGLRALRNGAEGFGEHGVARFVEHVTEAAARLDPRGLAAVDEAAALLSRPDTRPEDLSRRLAELSGQGPAVGLPAVAASAPPPMATGAGASVGRREGRGLTPTGRPLDSALDQTLARLGALDDSPFSEPAPIPIDALVYRGASALGRAREIRDALRTHVGPPDHELLAELYDLLDLAAAE